MMLQALKRRTTRRVFFWQCFAIRFLFCGGPASHPHLSTLIPELERHPRHGSPMPSEHRPISHGYGVIGALVNKRDPWTPRFGGCVRTTREGMRENEEWEARPKRHDKSFSPTLKPSAMNGGFGGVMGASEPRSCVQRERLWGYTARPDRVDVSSFHGVHILAAPAAVVGLGWPAITFEKRISSSPVS